MRGGRWNEERESDEAVPLAREWTMTIGRQTQLSLVRSIELGSTVRTITNHCGCQTWRR